MARALGIVPGSTAHCLTDHCLATARVPAAFAQPAASWPWRRGALSGLVVAKAAFLATDMGEARQDHLRASAIRPGLRDSLGRDYGSIWAEPNPSESPLR